MTFILKVTCTCSGLEVAPDVGCVWISPSGGRPGLESHSLGRRDQARQWNDTELCSKVGGLSYQVAGNGRWEVGGCREKWQMFYITTDSNKLATHCVLYVQSLCNKVQTRYREKWQKFCCAWIICWTLSVFDLLLYSIALWNVQLHLPTGFPNNSIYTYIQMVTA